MHISDDTPINTPKHPDSRMKMVLPGSLEWLFLQQFLSRTLSPETRQRWLEPLLWYEEEAYDGEFVHDFICAGDLMCWARDGFDRLGDKWPEADGRGLVRLQCLDTCSPGHAVSQPLLSIH